MTGQVKDPALERLRFPIGRYQRLESPGAEDREGWIADLAALPARMRAAVDGLTDAQLDTPYRDGGWTVRQVVHHVPDSHLNAYVRFNLAVAEEGRAATIYDEKRWAEQPFARTAPPEPSLALLDALHRRWVAMIRDLEPAQWRRTISHPEWGTMSVDDLVNLYAWHSRHHVAHITTLRERQGW